MNRLEYNQKIYDILKDSEIGKTRMLYSNFAFKSIAEQFKEFIEEYPNQRAGQIFCNYICYDYREECPRIETTVIMGTLFPNNYDPFFEESSETFNRLKNETL